MFLILIVILLLTSGGGAGYYGYNAYGPVGAGIPMVLVVLLLWMVISGGRFR